MRIIDSSLKKWLFLICLNGKNGIASIRTNRNETMVSKSRVLRPRSLCVQPSKSTMTFVLHKFAILFTINELEYLRKFAERLDNCAVRPSASCRPGIFYYYNNNALALAHLHADHFPCHILQRLFLFPSTFYAVVKKRET